MSVQLPGKVSVGDTCVIRSQDPKWDGLRVKVAEVGFIRNPKWGLEADPDGDQFYVTPLDPRPDGHGTVSFYLYEEDTLERVEGGEQA